MKLQIDGVGTVEIGDDFKNLTPEDQEAFVGQIRQQAGKGVRSSIGAAEKPKEAAPSAKSGGGFLQSIDDAVRLAASGATLGYADKIAALMGGAPVEEERARTDAARGRLGLLGNVAEIAGSLAPVSRAAKAVEAGGAALRPILGSAATNPYAQAAATGSGLGAASAVANDQDIATGAGLGAGAGLGGQAIGGLLSRGVGGIAGMFNKAPPAPTAQELRDAASAAYKASEDAGVIVNKEGAGRLAGDVKTMLADFGYDPFQQPAARGVVKTLARLPEENITLKGLDILRRNANNLRMSNNRGERKLGGMVVGKIDEFASGLQPGEIMSGDAPEAVGLLNQARELYKRSAKASELETAVEKAAKRAASTGTGGNVENATRQELRKIVDRGRSWTPDERAALEREVQGTLPRNVLRSVGGLSPDKGVIPLMANIGAIAADPTMMVGSMGAMAARRGSELMQRRAIDELSALIRSGGDAAARQPSKNAVQRFAEDKAPMLTRGILAGMLYGLPAGY